MSDGRDGRTDRQHPNDRFQFPGSLVADHSAPGRHLLWLRTPGIFRVDLINNVQSVVNANAPAWQPNHAYRSAP